MRMIISIDIGTSYSSLCFKNSEGKAQPIEISTGLSIYGGKYSLPSAVFVNDDGSVIVGQAAMNSRKLKPQNFRAEFKRDLGQSVPIVLGDRSFLPEDLYTELFLHMKSCIKKISNEEIEKVYITHPASFGQTKKEKIEKAAKNAGFYNIVLLDEPTAAAMCCTANGTLKDGDVFLVYDFGGGTFDTALIGYQNRTFRSVAPPSGIEHCGGIDIDRAIYSDMLAKLPAESKEMLSANPLNKLRFESQLAELAVKVKHHLSASNEITEIIPVGFDVLEYTLNRNTLNNMIASLVEQSIECCRKMLSNEKMTVKDISGILLVGGTSRVPLIRESLEKFAGETPVYADVDPELAIAEGALEYNVSDAEPEPDNSFEATFKLAESGDADAQYRLAEIFCNGDENGEHIDKAEAVKWYEIAANNGHIESCFEAGRCYADGTEVDKDINKGIIYLHKAAKAGYVPAQSYLGLMYYDENNYKKALSWLEKASEQTYDEKPFVISMAQCYLGNLYYNEDSGYQDYKKAVYYYEKAAADNDEEAQYMLGLCYYEGAGVEINYEKAFSLWTKAREGGEPRASAVLGICYLSGNGVAADYKKAVEMFEESLKANPDNKGVMYYLGNAYRNMGEPENLQEALKWYTKSAELGDSDALKAKEELEEQLNPKSEFEKLVRLAESGDVVGQALLGMEYKDDRNDYVSAAYWLGKAADQTYDEKSPIISLAQSELGNLYYYDIYGMQDYAKAVLNFKKAAPCNADAKYMLACCYYYGTGIEKDCVKAFSLWKEAEAEGEERSRVCLGICYSTGIGANRNYKKAIEIFEKVLKDEPDNKRVMRYLGNAYKNWGGTENIKEALKWYTKASKLGDEDATKSKEELEKQLYNKEQQKNESKLTENANDYLYAMNAGELRICDKSTKTMIDKITSGYFGGKAKFFVPDVGNKDEVYIVVETKENSIKTTRILKANIKTKKVIQGRQLGSGVNTSAENTQVFFTAENVVVLENTKVINIPRNTMLGGSEAFYPNGWHDSRYPKNVRLNRADGILSFTVPVYTLWTERFLHSVDCVYNMHTKKLMS